MKYSLKRIAAGAALALAGTAQAASADLDFSQQFKSVWGILEANISAIPPAHFAPVTTDPTIGLPPWVSIKGITTSVDDVVLDPSTQQPATVGLAGGLRIETTTQPNLSLGGGFTIENLSLDLSNQRVYASITGNFTGAATGTAGAADGAITTIDHFHLWNIQSITAGTVPGAASSFTADSLSITSDGRNHLVSALRLYATGTSALTTVSDYGSITVTSAVPEPSTWALALVGLAGIVALRQGRSAR